MHQLQGNKEFGSEKKGYLLKKSDGYDSVSLTCAGLITPVVYRQVLIPVHPD